MIHKNLDLLPLSVFSERAVAVFASLLRMRYKIEELIQKHDVGAHHVEDHRNLGKLLQQDYHPLELEEIYAMIDRFAPEIYDLPDFIALFEGLIEKRECERQIKHAEALHIKGYPSWASYENLVTNEWFLAQTLCDMAELPKMRFCFLGSGAMPMTAMMLADKYGVSVDCFDCDFEAYQLSKTYVEKAGFAGKVFLHHANALAIDYSDYDIVFVASLLKPRYETLARLRRFQNIRAIITRTVPDGLLSFFYPLVDEKMVDQAGFDIIKKALPTNKASFNQSMILKARAE
jgi:hypothetical protein